jgi:hypothetical protein
MTINFILVSAILMIHIHWIFCDAQIENEYGPLGKEFGAAGKSYSNWAAKMAIGLGTGVPWVMCKQDDAPDPVVQ